MVLELAKEIRKTVRVLLIEDDPDDALIIQDMLNESFVSRFEMVNVDRLKAGIAQVTQGSVDVVLLDLGLPDSMGLPTLHEIIETAESVPIIALTGLHDEQVAFQAVSAGAQDYLVKGRFDHDGLARAISYAIERKRMERELQQKERFFRSLIENAHDGTILVNGDGSLIYVSQSCRKMLGIKTDIMAAQDVIGRIHNDDLPKVKRAFARLLKKPDKMVRTEIRIWHQDGSLHHAEVVSNNRLHDPSVGGIVINIHDITERKQAEEKLLELDRMKAEFISNITHELRTPLHTIKGFNKLMLEGIVNDAETQKEYFAIIERESEDLDNLISDLLDVSRLESGRFSVQKQRHQAREVLTGIINRMQAMADEKRVQIAPSGLETLPEIELDASRIVRVMVNLLSNAIKFSDSCSVIRVCGEVQGDDLLIQVVDSGIGIATTDIPHLFDRFYQVESAKKDNPGGNGLGLYITKQIVEAHGGGIWVESILGEGTTMSFTLPMSKRGDN